MRQIDSELIEPIIVKLALTDEKYTSFLIQNFNKNWFQDKVLGELLNFCTKFYTKKNELPTLNTLELMINKFYEDSEKRKEVSSKLVNILDINLQSYNQGFLEDEILSYLKNNAFAFTIMNSMHDFQNNQEINCMDDFQKILGMTFNNDLGLNYFEDLDEHIDVITNPQERITTGWEEFDNITNGGFYKDGKCFVVFTACTGVGKSLVMSNIAANYIKKGLFPLIISLEMSEHIYAQRIDAHLSEIEMNNLRYKPEQLKSSLLNIKERQPGAEMFIKEYPPNTITTNTIKSYIENVIAHTKRKPDIILVDYINLINPSTSVKGDNTYIKYGNVSKELRALSYIFETPVISATQQNREGYNITEPTINTISESMQIAHDADAIFNLYQLDGDKQMGILRMLSTKNRLSGDTSSKIQFSVDYGNLKLTDDGNCNDEIMNDSEITGLLNGSFNLEDI